MIAILSLWSAAGWIGAKWRDLRPEGGKGELRWQDESGASRWGVGAQNCELSRASRLTPRLAPFRENRAFLPRNEPAAIRLPLQP